MSIDNQLKHGVRGLMLDIDNKMCNYFEKLINTCTCEGVCLCHGECSLEASNSLKDGFSVKNLEYALKKVVRFLDKNRDEIITLFIEDYLRETKQLQDIFDKIKKFNDLVFNPYSPKWNVTYKGWPKIKDMIKSNKRLLIVDDEQRGRHAKKRPGFIRYRDFFIENHYEWTHSKFEWNVTDLLKKSKTIQDVVSRNSSLLINGTFIELEMSDCFSRQSFKNRPYWNDEFPLQDNDFELNENEIRNSQKLFLFNHFYGVAAYQAFIHTITSSIMNKREYVMARLSHKCDLATNNKKPNFIALDFIDENVFNDLIRPMNS
jgi:hypothetical protein